LKFMIQKGSPYKINKLIVMFRKLFFGIWNFSTVFGK